MTACDTALWRVKEDVEGIFALDERCPFERLTVANTHLQTTLLTHLESLVRLDPMHLRIVDAQSLAVEAWMAVTLTYLDGVALDIRTYDE